MSYKMYTCPKTSMAFCDPAFNSFCLIYTNDRLFTLSVHKAYIYKVIKNEINVTRYEVTLIA